MDKHLVKVLILVALGLAVTVDAQGSAGGCAPQVRVRKGTVLKVSSKRTVNISCPVRYCEMPKITWFKLSASNTSYNIPVNERDQISITQEPSTAHEKEIISNLSFKSISNSDAGIYRCEASETHFKSQSHGIKVSVSDTILKPDNETLSPPILNYSDRAWMSDIILACCAVLILAAIVMLIGFLIVRRCICTGTPIKHAAEFTTVIFTLVTPTPTISEHDEDPSV